jgi:acetoin utilization deacetylase AcuC-like enzyme
MIHVAWSDTYSLPLPEGHRFPMSKYALLYRQLKQEQHTLGVHFTEPRKATMQDVLRVHDPDYVKRMTHLELTEKEMRAIGFPLTPELVEREFILVQGTIDCAKHALKYGLALNIAGGTHHAFSNRGEGFCLLNDHAVAAGYLLHHQLASRILIVDLDVHQGNGTAEIFRHTAEVFTLSIHGKDNYPLRKEMSDMDIELATGTTGLEYLFILQQKLSEALLIFKPDIILYNSGVDVLATDKYGKLKLTEAECMERDRLVFDAAFKENIPICAAMGGGYSPLITDIVNAHCNTFRTACALFQ